MEKIIVKGSQSEVGFSGKLIKEDIVEEVGATFRNYELPDGAVQEVETEDDITLVMTLKKK